MKASKKVLTYWPCQATQLQQKEYSDVNVAHIVLLGEKSNAAITNCGKKAMGGSVPQVVLDKKLREKKHRFIVWPLARNAGELLHENQEKKSAKIGRTSSKGCFNWWNTVL